MGSSICDLGVLNLRQDFHPQLGAVDCDGSQSAITIICLAALAHGPKKHRRPCQRSSQEGGIMCTHAITALVTSFILAVAGFFPVPAQAQRDSGGSAVQDLASNPIGKVVTATGSVTIERANAVVIQANVAGQAGRAMVGDLVYL